MAAISKGTTFATGDQVTALKLNNLVDNSTFASGAVDNTSTQLSSGAIIVKDGGVTTAKIADANVTTAKIADANVTPAKLSTGAPTWDASGNLTVFDNAILQSSIELGAYASGDRNSFVDFHSSDDVSQADNSARIIRGPGVNGVLDINQNGGGDLRFNRNGVQLGYFSGADGRLYLDGTGSRNGSGSVVTTPNDSVGNLKRESGYIEFLTDIGTVGTNYFLSDENKKENINPSNVKATPLIKSINFIEYDWKEESGMDGHVDIGVSAQQLRSLKSSLVNEMSDGGLQVNPNELLIQTTKALQEALIRIEALENA